MVRSLGLVGVIVVIVVLFNSGNQPAHPPVTVDIAATVQAARNTGAFPAIAASALPEHWYANSARFEPIAGEDGHWEFHIGYSDGEGGYLGIDATNADDPETVLGDGPLADPVESRVIAGVRFQRFAESENAVWRHAATAAEPYDILIGANTPPELEQLLSALRTEGEAAVGTPTAS